MLKLKQQQLQMMVRKVAEEVQQARQAAEAAEAKVDPYRAVLVDRAGVDLQTLAKPQTVHTTARNVAGVEVPVFESVEFPQANYSLFATPAWVDQALRDFRELQSRQAEREVRERQLELLQGELTKIVQRVNLFEKVKIPDCQEAIRRIRIQLGDEMTAAVGRAKIAKDKLTKSEETVYLAEADLDDGHSQEEARTA
jgi:V/A-type H+-transporting ATPase subunit D